MEENHTLKKTISRQERFYSLEGQYLMDGKKVRGLQFILQDCTDDMTGLLNRRAFENESLDIYELVREADKQMNLNKAEYYRTSGNDRRKIR